jgi:formimidoylglutamate deiminase
MQRYLARSALIGDRVEPDVLIDVAADGRISAVVPRSADPAAVPLPGLVVPGMANLHSHAFQRAMAGLAERGGPAGQDFWCWRDVMYRFLALLTPNDVEAIAAQLYVECLLHGYTAIGEFHYLHNAQDGRPYADPTEMSQRILLAAATAGIGLTLLPVLYRHADFGGVPASPAQARFCLSLEAYATLCQDLARSARIGVAPHSLRAVTPDELATTVALADSLRADTPIHIHIAEQTREVADSLTATGQRPVQWLLDHAPVGPRWCLVHATHIDRDERRSLAACGAVAGLCQTTEANLGDGRFPFLAYRTEGGRFGIGSDSHVSTSPVEELRWLDYTCRLETRTRTAPGLAPGASIGTGLFTAALAGGFQAIGRSAGRIAAGYRADLVVLDSEHPALVGRDGDFQVDAWIFSGNSTPVRDVMVDGHWVVRDGRHRRQSQVAGGFGQTMRRISQLL